MKRLRLQTINYERNGNAAEVLNEIETPRYPDGQLDSKARFLFFVTRKRGEAGEAVRFLDDSGAELARYGGWDDIRHRR